MSIFPKYRLFSQLDVPAPFTSCKCFACNYLALLPVRFSFFTEFFCLNVDFTDGML